MSHWVSHAINTLANAKGEIVAPPSLDLDPFIDSCQVQVVHAYRMDFLKNVSGGVAKYRSACESALGLLKEAKMVPIPFLGMQPRDDDHPQAKDEWQRQRERADAAAKKRQGLLAKAVAFLKIAAEVADQAMNVREAAEPRAEPKREPEKATAKAS